MNHKQDEATLAKGVRAGKRSQFTQEAPRSGGRGLVPLLAIAVGLSALALGLYLVLGLGHSQAGAAVANDSGAAMRRSAGTFTTVEPVNGAITLPSATFADGKARFYTLRTDGKEIDFFLLKSADGVVRAAIDACDVCFPARKGYHQEGGEMVCNNCGQRFPSAKINEVKGGCNPAPLTRTIVGDNVIIQVSDILQDGGQYF